MSAVFCRVCESFNEGCLADSSSEMRKKTYFWDWSFGDSSSIRIYIIYIIYIYKESLGCARKGKFRVLFSFMN